MKKLTAGIFATLLAVVSVGAAHAEIASKGYVDQQVGTKADAATVSSLQSTVSGHTSQIGTINGTIGGYGNIVTHDADEFATSAQGAKADTAVQPAAIADVERTTNKTTTLSAESTDAQYPSAKAVYDTIQAETSDIASSGDLSALQTRVTTAEGEIDTLQTDMAGKANTADLGDLAELDAVGSAQITDGAVATADIANKAVTEAKLSDTVNASLDKADSALQKTTADATYAVKALENQVGTVSKENMGTTTATTVVGGVKEAIDAAKAADTKATSAASAASTAQSAVDAVEATIGGYGDIVSHNASEFATAAQGTKADTAVQPAAISDMLTKTEAGTTYYTKTSGDALAGRVTTAEGEIDAIQAEMDNMATDESLAEKQDKTDNSLATTNKTVVGAINEVKTQADKGVSDAAAAKSAADAAKTAADSKLPTATYNTQVGTVSATNMGTTASTVVTAINEVASEAAAAASAASEADTKAGQAQTAADAAQEAAEAAQATASAAIPAPTAACADSANKCVLVSSGAGNYSWEVIARGDAE